MTDRRSGRCLCDAIQFSADITDTGLQACHCTQCQRWTGGGALYVVRVANVSIEGEEAISHHRASGHGERGFCAHCGSTIYWRMQGGEIIDLPVGLFDDQSGWTMAEEIFTDRRAPWMVPFAGAIQSTEAEQMAKLEEYLKKEKP
ncbi:MAG: GFA family protein [Pseudomonadota bacterium]